LSTACPPPCCLILLLIVILRIWYRCKESCLLCLCLFCKRHSKGGSHRPCYFISWKDVVISGVNVESNLKLWTRHPSLQLSSQNLIMSPSLTWNLIEFAIIGSKICIPFQKCVGLCCIHGLLCGGRTYNMCKAVCFVIQFQICFVISAWFMYFKSLTPIPPIYFSFVIISHVIGLMYLSIVPFLCPCQRNLIWILSISLIIQFGNIKVDMKKIGTTMSA
jgi:hypothetical protein